MNIKFSNKLPYWARETDNKCSIKELENFYQNMQSFEGNLNFVDDEYITLISKENPNINNNKFKYYIAFEQDGLRRYYYYDNVHSINNNNYVCTYKLDFYATFTILFIRENLESEFTFLRTHAYKPLCLQYNEKFLEDLPKIYSEYKFVKCKFDSTEIMTDEGKQTLWYTQNRGISGEATINANKYFVFRNNHGVGYKFYPVLSLYGNTSIWEANYSYENEPYKEGFFYHGHASGQGGTVAASGYEKDEYEIPAEANDNISTAYIKGDKIIYKFPEPWVKGYWGSANGDLGYYVIFKYFGQSSSAVKYEADYGVMPRDIKQNCSLYNNFGGGLWSCYCDAIKNGNVIGKTYTDANGLPTIVGNQSWLNTQTKEGTKIKYEIYKRINNFAGTYSKKVVNNSYPNLDTFMRKEENINKFVGVFYAPHFLNMNNVYYEDDKVYVLMDTNNQLDYFKIYQYELSNVENKINNDTYSTPYLLKYLNVKYYGNLINSEYRINDRNILTIGGDYFYTDTSYLISKNNDLISLNNSIIQYPYMLPICIDKYEQYVAANRNSTDVAYSNLKKQVELQRQQTNFNGIIDIIQGDMNGGLNSFGSLLKGDVFGAIKGGTNQPFNIAKGIGNLIYKNKSLDLKLETTQASMLAQYNKAFNTMGNVFLYSNVESAILKNYYDAIDEQYEGVEVSYLDKSTLILINNYIYLYGYFYQQTLKLKDMLNEERKFNYIQVDKLVLANQLNINKQWFNNNIFAKICEDLSNGIRIWNKFEITKDDIFNPEDVKPPYNPNLPKPNPPVSDENILNNIEVDLDKITGLTFNSSNFLAPFDISIHEIKPGDYDNVNLWLGYRHAKPEGGEQVIIENYKFNKFDLTINLPNLNNIYFLPGQTRFLLMEIASFSLASKMNSLFINAEYIKEIKDFWIFIRDKEGENINNLKIKLFLNGKEVNLHFE